MNDFPVLVGLIIGLLIVATKRGKKSKSSSASWWRRYNAYLRSAEWKMRREGVLLRSGGKCERCAKVAWLSIHHTTYERVGNELPEDLAALCYDCHKLQHPGKKF